MRDEDIRERNIDLVSRVTYWGINMKIINMINGTGRRRFLKVTSVFFIFRDLENRRYYTLQAEF